MGELLSSYSIIIALIALFYSQWTIEVEAKISKWNIPNEDREDEREKYLKDALTLIRSKLYPLLFTSIFFTILVAVEVFKILSEMIHNYTFNLSDSYFESVKSMVILIFVLILLIDWKLIKYTVVLHCKICKGK